MDKSLRFELRLSPEMKAMFEAAAERDGLGLAEWLRLAGLASVRTARYKEPARSPGVVVESVGALPTTPTSSFVAQARLCYNCERYHTLSSACSSAV